jgi:6-pyruvoyltetrahydropterin/6-carboxytetrahydropterin synthase
METTTGAAYSVSVERSFVAQHYLTVPDCGRENELHSHTYTAEVEARGSSLDEHNYLIDIVGFEEAVERVTERYRDETLNDAPGFEGNPSAEQFARVFAEGVSEMIDVPGVDSVVVRMGEDDRATVSYENRL